MVPILLSISVTLNYLPNCYFLFNNYLNWKLLIGTISGNFEGRKLKTTTVNIDQVKLKIVFS